MIGFQRSLAVVRGLFFVASGVGALGGASSAWAAGSQLTAVWNHHGTQKSLKSWSFQETSSLMKQLSSKEKDPVSSQMTQFKGPSLSALVDAALKDLTAEERAQIDLVILKNDAGAKALIPRAFIVKYPLLLATSRDQKPLTSDQGPYYSVAPWTSKPKIAAEGMALESLFIPQVTKIEFSNYREQFSGLFLKRRTDPAAMRGEKLFVQNCLSCHTTGPGPSVGELSGAQKSRSLASAGHPRIKGAPKLGDKEIRSLTSYLEAYHSENPSGFVKAVSAR